MLQREGLDTKVEVMLYSMVLQVVLVFGWDYWFLSTAMDKTVEGAHTGFLQKIRGKRERRMIGKTWVTLVAEELRQAVGTQSAATYIGRRHGTVSQWVALIPTF